MINLFDKHSENIIEYIKNAEIDEHTHNDIKSMLYGFVKDLLLSQTVKTEKREYALSELLMRFHENYMVKNSAYDAKNKK